jgi:hypothetical protein
MRIIAPDVHRSFAQMAILENGTLRDAGTGDLERSRLLWVAQAPGASPRTGTGTPSAKAAGDTRHAERRLGPLFGTTEQLGEKTQGEICCVGPPCSWARRRLENWHGHKRLLIPGLNAAVPCAVPPPHKLAAAAPLQLPGDPHPQIALDRHTVRPVEVGCVVSSGEETEVLRHRRDDAAANFKRGRAKGGRKHD